MKKAIYPGSFDPMHQGHIGIIEKALKLFETVYVVITNNPEKTDQGSIEQRYEVALGKLSKHKNVVVEMNKDQYTADFAKERNINFIIRSARDNQDFKYELELALANKHLNQDLETIIIIPDEINIDFHSRLIKQGVK